MAKSNYQANEAKLNTSKANLIMIGLDPDKLRNGEVTSVVSLYSPINGAVLDVYTTIGKYVGPQNVIMD